MDSNAAPLELPADAIPDDLNSGSNEPTDGSTQPTQIPTELPANAVSDEDKYGSLGQQAIAGAEGVGQGLIGGLAPAAEIATGITTPEDIKGREAMNPWTHGIGEVVGFGAGPAKVLKSIGLIRELPAVANAVKAATIAGKSAEEISLAAKAAYDAAPLTAKIGSAAVRGAIENAVFQGSDESAKFALGDPTPFASTAAMDIGLASMLGGAVGGSVPGVQSLWKAAKGSDLGIMLRSLTSHAGGIEGAVPSTIDADIAKAGIDMAPTVVGALSDDPRAASAFLRVNQSDSSSFGKQVQQDFQSFRKNAGNGIIESLGKDPEDIDSLQELSKAEAGKDIGKTLAKEWDARITPQSEVFDKLKAGLKDRPLMPDGMLPDGSKVLGTVSNAVDKISKLATDQGWSASPSSDIMKEVNRVITELPLQKDIKNLSDYISQVGNNMQSDPMNGPMNRAGGMIKSILRDSEADAIQNSLGEKGGQEAIDTFKQARAGWAAEANLKESLDDRLHAKGSVGGYGKALRNMASTDSETLLNRLSPVNDANMIDILTKNFPETAAKLKDFHIDTLLKNAAMKAKGDLPINSEAVLKTVANMQPEMRDFLISPEGQARMGAIGNIVGKFNEMPHNYSNTARTLMSKLARVPGSAVGLVAGIAGHMPVMGAVLGGLAHQLGTKIPDALDYSLLKFLGSAKNVDAEGFKAMTDTIERSLRGDKMLSKSAANVFNINKEGLSESAKPSAKDLEKLDRVAQQMQQNPQHMQLIGQKVAHYMPEHATALAQIASSATQYLNSNRPTPTRQSPLDTEIPPTKTQESNYNNILAIAQQPLIVLDKMKRGTLTSNDVTAMHTMYPDLYNRTVQKLTDNMMKAQEKGQQIPYATRMSLSLFMGQPLDSTMTPQSIQMAMNATSSPAPAPAPQKKSKGRGASPALAKLPNLFKTPGQEAEASKAER